MAKVSSVPFVALTIAGILVSAVVWLLPSDVAHVATSEGADVGLPRPDRNQPLVQTAKPLSNEERE